MRCVSSVSCFIKASSGEIINVSGGRVSAMESGAAILSHGDNATITVSDGTVENIADLIPNIFEKISGNMACYFDEILNNKMITN